MFIFSGWNVKKLASYEEGKRNAKFIGSLFRNVFRTGREEGESFLEKDSFDEFIESTGVTKKDLKARIKTAKLFIKVYLTAGCLLGLYAIYIFSKVSFLAGLSTLIFSALMLLYAFKEHVMIYKIRHKKLSCTVPEWFRDNFMKKKSANTTVPMKQTNNDRDS